MPLAHQRRELPPFAPRQWRPSGPALHPTHVTHRLVVMAAVATPPWRRVQEVVAGRLLAAQGHARYHGNQRGEERDGATSRGQDERVAHVVVRRVVITCHVVDLTCVHVTRHAGQDHWGWREGSVMLGE